MLDSRAFRLVILATGLATVLLAGAQPVRGEAEAEIVVFLVRHAEPIYPPPEDNPKDPPLNVMGQDRADALARLLSPAGIERVYSSDYQRTRETAAPLAARLGLQVETYDPSDLPALAAKLLQPPGRSVVVGHSNTTPQVVELLGGDPGEPIDEKVEFDRLYVVVGSPANGFTTLVMRYGAFLPNNWRELAASRRRER